MMFKFVGRYTNGHTAITVFDVTFNGHDPAEVSDPKAIARLSKNIEFQAVEGAMPPALVNSEIRQMIAAFDHDGDGKPGGSLPKVRRRRRKAD